MRLLPLISLTVAVIFAALAWRRRAQFAERPYLHWFVYLHLAAVGLHQFEEYGWPGGFRAAFSGVFALPRAAVLIPSLTALELFNALGLTLVFGLAGWYGTRRVAFGLGVLYLNFANAFFHLVFSVVRMSYVPGTVTGALLYLPLTLLATRFAVRRDDVSATQLLLALALGTAASLLPFVHIWALVWMD